MRKELWTSSGFFYLATFLTSLIYLITLPLLTGSLTRAEYGAYDLANTAISILVSLMSLQVQSAAFRFLIDVNNDQNHIDEIVSTLLIFIGFTAAVISILAIYISKATFATARILIALWFFLQMCFRAEQYIFRGLELYKIYAAYIITQSAMNMICIFICLIGYRMGLSGVLLSICVSTLVSLILFFFLGNLHGYFKWRAFSGSLLKQMLRYSLPIIPYELSFWILGFSDRVILSYILGTDSNAIYAAANIVPGIITIVNEPFINAWQTAASKAVSVGQSTAFISDVFDNAINGAAALVAATVGATPLLFSFLVKGDYGEAYMLMPILFIGFYFYCLSSYLGSIYIANMKTVSVGMTTLAAAVVNIIVHVSLIGHVGIYAAAISTMISYLSLFLFRLLNIKSFQEIDVRYEKILLYTGFLTLFSLACTKRNPTLNIFNILLCLGFALYVNRKAAQKLWQWFHKRYRKERR